MNIDYITCISPLKYNLKTFMSTSKIQSYGECQQNVAAACRLYAEMFLLRKQLAPGIFIHLVIGLRDTVYQKGQRGVHAGTPTQPEMLQIKEYISEMVVDQLSMAKSAII